MAATGGQALRAVREMTDFMTVTLDRDVETFTRAPRQLFINGKWADAASGKTFETPNPATGETLAHIAEGDAEDINRAVRAARRAFESGPWSRMTPSERGRIIWRIGDLILEHADELAQLESLDNGKPYVIARAADIQARQPCTRIYPFRRFCIYDVDIMRRHTT